MINTTPVETYAELAERFPGIDQQDAVALGRFAFHAAAHEPHENMRYGNEDYQEWHSSVRDVISRVYQWKEDSAGASRLDLARLVTEERVDQIEQDAVAALLDSLPTNEAYEVAVQYIVKKGWGVKTEFGASPLFPEGRVMIRPAVDRLDTGRGFSGNWREDQLVDERGEIAIGSVAEFLEKTYRKRLVSEAAESVMANLEMVTPEQLQLLREKYGSKAAYLMCLNNKLCEISEVFKPFYELLSMEIPEFRAVSVDMYDAWQQNSGMFDEMLESARIQALEIRSVESHDHSGGLVVIRSSAVWSEDGEASTGAGIYASLVVDPCDSVAFRNAVEAVYVSTNSQRAIAYRESINVETEQMGLLLQRYIEERGIATKRNRDIECFYGNAESQGAHRNLVQVHTQLGTFQYDRAKLEANLFVNASRRDDESFLHTFPDRRSPLRDGIHKTDEIPHAVMLAEKLFGRPMQIEFANNHILQARPLVQRQPEQYIEFPDANHVIELSAVGYGDMILPYLESNVDNSEREGYVVFEQEYAFTIRESAAWLMGRDTIGDNAFPKKGAVIIMRPSSAGHIQALCREKGLLCFYPQQYQSEEDLDELKDLLYAYDGSRYSPPEKTYRFVADGYNGRMYEVENEDRK